MKYTAKSKAQRSYNIKMGITFGTDSKNEIDACGKRKEDTDFLPTLQAGYIKKQRWEERGRMRHGVCARRLAEWNGPEHGAWCLMVWLSDWKSSWRGMRKRCASCFLEFLRSVILMHPLQNPSFYFILRTLCFTFYSVLTLQIMSGSRVDENLFIFRLAYVNSHVEVTGRTC